MKDKKKQIIQWTFPYWGPYLFKKQLTKQEIKHLLKNAINKEDHSKNLAGHIKKEFVYPEEILQKTLNRYFRAYLDAASRYYNQADINNSSIGIKGKAWINYMEAGEFNPPHFHTGGDLSFVIYLQIPKALEKEHKAYKGTSCGPGGVVFINEPHRPFSVTSTSYFPKVGDLFIFPSNLHHWVYPFKSKGERISISANTIWKRHYDKNQVLN